MLRKIDYSYYYKKWHKDTPGHIEEMKRYFKRILSKYLPIDRNISILDIGCGMGFTMLALQDLGYYNIEGIEIDKEQCRSCWNKNLKVTHVDDSTDYLKKRPENYDLILCLDLIEHIPLIEQIDFLSMVFFSLKPKGKIICTVPNANSVLACRWRYNDWTHHISFTEYSLDFLLYSCGFRNIQIFEVEFLEFPKFDQLFSKRIFKKWFWKWILQCIFFCLVRTFRRIEMIAELGWDEGKKVPLSLNLFAIAEKPL